jgi:cytochrome c553
MRRQIVLTAIVLSLVPIAAVYAIDAAPMAGDAAAGKLVAAGCTSCHGAQGIGAKTGVPHIAGQSPSYLVTALAAYQAGGRKDDDMQKAVAKLSQKDVADVAAYYASLASFNKRPADSDASPAPTAEEDPFAAVKKLTEKCASCHGDDGNASVTANPSLAGQRDDYLIASMQAYLDGTRDDAMMKSSLKSFDPSQIEDIAYFYAAAIPAAAAAPGKGDPLAGVAVAAPCATCHGADGNSSDPKNPRLAGLSAKYLIAAIEQYKDGTRKHAVMHDKVLALRDEDVKNVAAYYASKEAQALPIRKPLTLTEWTARCDRCHGAGGTGFDPRFPVLAGQDKAYLAKVMEEYHLGKRENQLMFAMSFLMGRSDIDKLSDYYARQRAP